MIPRKRVADDLIARRAGLLAGVDSRLDSGGLVMHSRLRGTLWVSNEACCRRHHSENRPVFHRAVDMRAVEQVTQGELSPSGRNDDIARYGERRGTQCGA